MRAISEFRQQKQNVLYMSFSINKFGFSGFEATLQYDSCEMVEETIKAICAVHKTDGNIAACILKDAQDLGRSYGYDQDGVLMDICFFYRDTDNNRNPVRLEQGKRYD